MIGSFGGEAEECSGVCARFPGFSPAEWLPEWAEREADVESDTDSVR